MRFLIIGLGIYGSNLAKDLTALGHEVIGADVNSSLVESIKEYISTAYIIDSTDEIALNVLPLKNIDLAIVAIGENFGASIKTVALLKKLQVKHLYARAIDQLHESILEGIGVDRILNPEQRAARDLVDEMTLGGHIDSLQVDNDVYVIKFNAPDFMMGEKYAHLDLSKDFGINLIAITRPYKSRNVIGIVQTRDKLLTVDGDESLIVEHGDKWVCIGTTKALSKLSQLTS